jgi:hypothetical protein
VARTDKPGAVLVIVLAFDVDGTLDCSSGPVPTALLDQLTDAGYGVAVVSPSAAYKEEAHAAPRIVVGARVDNLRAAKARFPDARICLYVSDNGDQEQAEMAGCTYVDRLEFAKGLVPRSAGS